jgi:tagatose 6-phosphate kinase
MILTVTLNSTVDKTYHIPKLLPGEVIRVQGVAKTAGGKGINVAKVAKLLGNDVAATGFLGGDTGEYINTFLTDAGIVTEFIFLDAETRTCVTVNDIERGEQTVLLEPGAHVNTEKQQEFIRHYTSLLPKSDAVVLGGSLPEGIDKQTFYPQLIALAKKAGKPVVLDTSGETLKAGIDALPTIIKPNREELSAYLGRTIDTIDEVIVAAKELNAKGIDIVIVSLGKDGAVYVMNNEVYRGKTPPIKVANTVGCGDSLVAGFLTGLTKKMSIEETIRLAMAVSTANALSVEIGSFLQSDLDDLLTKVTVTKL